MQNKFQGLIRKVVIGSQVMVFQNTDFENIVRRRLAAEGHNPDTFSVGPRAWGKRLTGTPFVENGGAHYLEVIFLRQGEVQYHYKGMQVFKEDIDGLPPERDAPEHGVIIRCFHTDSIKKVGINGKHYS